LRSGGQGLDSGDEFLEDLGIQGACSGRFWMELATDDEPVVEAAFNAFDDSILATGGDFESIGESIDGHVVSAVDADFTLSIDAAENGLRFDDQGVSVAGVLGIEVRQCVWKVDRDMVEEISAFDDVDELESGSDGHQRQATLGDFPSQLSVEVFSSSFHGADRAVEHETVFAGIEVPTADENKSVEGVEDFADATEILRRRDDHRNPACLGDRVEVPGSKKSVSRGSLVGSAVITVHSDQGFACHVCILRVLFATRLASDEKVRW